MTMERETAGSNNTPQENESSGLAVAETTTPDSGIKKVEDPKSNAQYEDTVKKSVDGETNETPNITNGEEEGENPITIDKDEENEKIEDMKGNNMTQSVQDTSEDDELDDELGDELDDEEDVMWEDDEEYSEEGSETAVAVDDEVNEEDAINEEENAEEDAENDEGNAEEGDQKKAEVEKKIVKGNVGEVEEHNKEKMEVILRNAKKSRRRGNKVGEETLKKLDTGDKAGSSQKRKGKKRVESMGMIFICSSKTKKDCYKYRVLGLPESKKDMVEKIYTGMRLFLYDVDLKLMYGIYKAAGPGGYNIEPRAFKSQFPSQVRFTVLDDCLPLAEEKFKKIIQENYYTKTKFDCKLNSEQVKKLCMAFVSINKGQLPKNLGKKQLPVHRDKTRRRKRGDDERRPPLREEARYERPRKRTRQQQAISPTRQPLPPLIRSTVPLYPYNNNRTLDGEAYRRDLYLESRDPFLKRGDHYRDEHAPYLERRDPYRDRQDSYLVDGDQEPYLVQHNSEAYLMARDTESYLVGRESRDPYRLRRDPYPEHHRDGRASYLESRGLLEDGPRYRRDPHPPPPPPMLDYREDRRVVYRDLPLYRREEVLESRRHDPYVSYREQRPLYAEAEPLYYPTRSGMAREYHRL